MTDTKTTITDTDNKEEQNTPSDARIILGPLVKYAAVGFVLVSIIITTAVMLDSQFNDIDREVAELQAQLEQEKKNTVVEDGTGSAAGSQAEATSTVEAEAVQPQPAVAEVTEAEKPAAKAVAENTVDTAPAVTLAAPQVATTETIVTESSVAENAVVEDALVEDAVAEGAVVEDAVVEEVVTGKANSYFDDFDKSIDELIAERNRYLKEMDLVYLEKFKASQDKQLQFMRERLARQEQRIEEKEKRNQEIYDVRAARFKERQQMRENFLPDRI